MVDLTSLTVTAALRDMSQGRLTSIELLDAQLARIERYNPSLNLVVALDVERARAEAVAADKARATGTATGELHGLPMTVKDSFETKGLVTTSGAPALASHIPPGDANAVAALRAAGAIVFGKTNLPLYAGDLQTFNDVYGLSRNPWDVARTTGGSSGGAAAAVAAGMTLAELGSDIGGSIRSPAHYNGVVGHKPTWGIIDGRGHIPGPPGVQAPGDLGVMGPLARCVDDVHLLFDVLTRGAPGQLQRALPPAPRRALRITVWDRHPALPTGSACVAAVHRAADALVAQGAHLVDAPPPVPLDEQYLLYLTLLNAALAPGMPPGAIERARAQLAAGDCSPVQCARARGFVLTHSEWLRADERRWRLIADYERFFQHVDVVLAPVSPVPAFPHDIDRPFDERRLLVDDHHVEYVHLLAWAGLATLPSLPSTAVPVGMSPESLPVGVQLIGNRFADYTTLAAARVVESAYGFVAPPLG
jgi:amidase